MLKRLSAAAGTEAVLDALEEAGAVIVEEFIPADHVQRAPAVPAG